jgi:hypothetical protein
MLTSLTNAIQALNATHWIAVAALVVSLTSLTFSVLGYMRDQPKLKIRARLYRHDDDQGGPGCIEVKVVNLGRRPIYLVMLWGADKKGVGSGTSFDYQGPGIKLGEHEFKTFRVSHLPRGADEFLAATVADVDIVDFERLSIEDSTGKRYRVPGAGPLLAALLTDYKEWCEKTGYWRSPAPNGQPVAQIESDAAAVQHTSPLDS